MSEKWKSQPIDKTCQVIIGKNKNKWVFCGGTTTHVYPAAGGGYMSLCREHSRKHTGAWPIQEVDEILV